MDSSQDPMETSLSNIQDSEDEFNWQEYLEATNSKAVPHTVFNHVDQSLQNGFEIGMKLEVPLQEKPDCHWIATVVMACGPLLRLQYEEETDKRKVFWCDTNKVVTRPLGWCEANKQRLEPPEHLADIVNPLNVKQNLKDALSVPPELLSGDGCTPVDRIKPCMKVEVQDLADPYRMWIATIVENIGGRLLLRYDTPEGASLKDFWLFYSSPRIHPLGWANERGPPWVLRKPSSIVSSHTIEDWQSVLEKSKSQAENLPFPRDILNKNRKTMCPHDVAVGNKLEAIHPVNMSEVCPATVVKIFDSYHFLVAVDVIGASNNSQLSWLATSSHPYIFPIGWAAKHELKVTHPRGWSCAQDEFDWPAYLAATNSVPAPLPPRPGVDLTIEVGMKLEAVDIEQPNYICVATVQQITDHLLWIYLENVDRLIQQNIKERFWSCFKQKKAVSLDSLDIFPVGWCASNCYALKAPKMKPTQTQTDKNSPSKEESPKEIVSVTEKSSSWCPKIYFNHRCFSGPFLSKGRLAGLPQEVGPGPVTLVMKEVLSKLISVAYISSRVLRELQCTDPPRPGMHLEQLKAKYKNNVYRATVEIITSTEKVAEFCKEVCHKLQVCPNLFSLEPVGSKSCPENCQTLSKTRFMNTSTASTAAALIGQRRGRPPDSVRKTQKSAWPLPRRPPSTRREYLSMKNNNAEQGSDSRSASDDGASKDKRLRYETRGVKLPNFGLKNSQVKKALETVDTNTTPATLAAIYKKRGRRSKADSERIKKMEELFSESKMDDSQYDVETNPLLWTVEDVFHYITRTQDCNALADILRDEEFDGKALMLLNLPSCLDELCLNQKMALKLCRHVEAVKFAFFSRYVTDMNPG